MNRVSSIFSQLLQFFPRLEFQALVRDHAAEQENSRGPSSQEDQEEVMNEELRFR